MTHAESPDGAAIASLIAGRTAIEIVADIRRLIERGALAPERALPPVRALAHDLGVNRNTIVAAYRQLAQAGLVESRGRAGTRVAALSSTPQEGASTGGGLRDIAAGNPDPRFIPDASLALSELASRPVLYGEPVIDAGLARWAAEWMRADAPDTAHLTITNGAFDAVERLLAQALTRDDAVAIEDPGFLATIRTVRLAGYRPVAVPVDEEGMTVEGLRAALAQGVRAVVVTPRAQNPTGASLSAERARALRALLAEHPYVLVVEDDHFSLLSQRPHHSLIGPDHGRWALVRSVSKFLGPDMSLAVVASDPHTAERLALRLSPGTTWVSHLLQRLAHALLTADDSQAMIARAGTHYAERNAAFVARLAERGVDAATGEGLTLWIPVDADAGAVTRRLAECGWRVRSGDEFQLRADAPSRHLRITVHHLDDAEQRRLVDDILRAQSPSDGEGAERGVA